MKKILKKLNLFDYFLILSFFVLILIVVYNYFILERIEYKNINKSTNTIIEKINKNEIISDYKKLKIKSEKNRKTYNVLYEYISDVIDDTNYINDLDNNKDYLNILSFNELSVDSKKETINDIKTKLDEKYNHLKNINKKDYNKELNKNNKKVFNKYVDKINIANYVDKYNKHNANIDFINKNLEFIGGNIGNIELNDGVIVFKKRNIFNSYEESFKDNKEISVKKLNYRLIDDKNGPNIEASNITINAGNKVDIKSRVKCVDEVDDNVECIVSGNYNVNKVGTYKINIKATDVSGNTSSKDITLTVKSNAVSGNKSKPYYIEVIRNQNVVVVYGLDSNNYYSRIVKVFVASVGKSSSPTPTGTYKTTRGNRWGGLFGGVYGQYTTRIVGNILFHSVPYYSASPDNLEWEEYNKLGTGASLGCIRLRVSDVKWIFDNCPNGTTVKIYDGNLPAGVSKPSAQKISGSSPNRGWDPTDPSPNNPWK